MRLGIREGMMYRVLGQLVVGSKGILDQRSVSVVESSGRVASSKTISWYDMILMDEKSMISNQSATKVAGGSSSFRGSNYSSNNRFDGVRD
jgi:hypothetical protein